MSLKIIPGDILDCTEQYLCHQCNSFSNHAAGLAKSIFERFPYADIYSRRRGSLTRPVLGEMPGNIVVCGDGEKERFVINMLGQMYPGQPKYSWGEADGYKAREKYFYSCLTHISHLPGLKSLALPWGIGCGLAGGCWDNYFAIIEEFEKINDVDVVLYKLNT